MKKKYYHASPRRFRHGQVLTARNQLHLTDSPLPHYTVFEEAYKGNWHVYEIEPIGQIHLDKCWDAWVGRAGRVVRYVGKARGIIGHKQWNQFQIQTQTHTWNGEIPGSAARWQWSKMKTRTWIEK